MSTDTRQRIVSSAIELFARDGQHGVALRDIAAHADVLLGTIFYHFKQKGLLYQAAVAEAYAQRTIRMRATLVGPDPAELRLRAFIEDMLVCWTSDDPHMLLADWNADKSIKSEVSDAVLGTFNENYVHMARVIAEIEGRSVDREAIDPRVAYLFALVTGFAKLYREYGEVLKLRREGSATAIANDMAGFIIGAIKAGKTPMLSAFVNQDHASSGFPQPARSSGRRAR